MLNSTAEFYNPSNTKNKTNNLKQFKPDSKSCKNIIASQQEGLNNKSKGKSLRAYYNPYGPKLRIRSTSNKYKYQMYNPQSTKHK
mmetsp:Transcript_9525/g.8386  ORF Transcript_9525/g.8386 Transcript_9525/m.8386 type:complete len:85 (+) Transcript_9525:1-255(+)